MPTPTAPTGHTFGGWYLDGAAVTSTTQNTTIGDHTLTANWVAICYASDLNIYNPSGSADGASGTCNITYVKNGITYASGTNTTNETWSWNSDIFPYGTVITVSNITIPTGRKLSKVVIGGQTISGSNGVYTYTMTGNANVLIYTQLIPPGYFSSNWATRLSLTASSVTSIVFTQSASAIPSGWSSASVGTNSATDTSAYSSSSSISDVTAYYNSGKTSFVIYCPGIIYAPESCKSMFTRYTALTTLTFNNFDTSNVTNMEDMFYVCSSLTSLNVSNFNTSKVTTMKGMFDCTALTSLDISNFDTSKVEDIQYMFNSCTHLTSLNFYVNLISCHIVRREFDGCTALTSITLPYNVQKTITMPSGFKNITSSNCSTATNKVTLTR